jgi:quinol monooxygenase YgiN
MTVQVMTLTYDVEAGDFALFRAAVIKRAELARKRETGCMRFDVNFGAERQTLCLTCAVFVSSEALDYHLRSLPSVRRTQPTVGDLPRRAILGVWCIGAPQ